MIKPSRFAIAIAAVRFTGDCHDESVVSRADCGRRKLRNKPTV